MSLRYKSTFFQPAHRLGMGSSSTPSRHLLWRASAPVGSAQAPPGRYGFSHSLHPATFASTLRPAVVTCFSSSSSGPIPLLYMQAPRPTVHTVTFHIKLRSPTRRRLIHSPALIQFHANVGLTKPKANTTGRQVPFTNKLSLWLLPHYQHIPSDHYLYLYTTSLPYEGIFVTIAFLITSIYVHKVFGCAQLCTNKSNQIKSGLKQQPNKTVSCIQHMVLW